MPRQSLAMVSIKSVLMTLAIGGCGSSGDDKGAAGSASTVAGQAARAPEAGSGGSPAPSGGRAAPSGGSTAPGRSGMGGNPATGGSGDQPAAAGVGAENAGSGGAAGSGEAPMTAASGCGTPTKNPMIGNACPGSPPPALKLTEITAGLQSPTFVMQAPGDPSRFYVLEQQGTVRVVKDGQLLPEPFIDLRDLSGAPVNNTEILPGSYGEGGLLGGAFDPRFEETKRFWLSYTKPGPAFTVAQFELTDPDKADVTNYKELLTFPQYGFFGGDETNHVGSMLAFGPDGCMYVSRGDGGGENDRQMSGQKTSDDLCSILRIDVDTYPTAAPGNLEGHVWNYGFRNPWRHSFDRETGDLYIGDVGQDANSGFEEVNIEPRGEMGRNYGWSVAQGSTTCEGDCGSMTKPALEYPITGVTNSVIGGYVYRGTKIPGLVGRYLWADWTERVIKSFVYKGEANGQAEICDAADTTITVPTKVRSFGEGLDGEIYVVAAGAPTNGLTSAGLTEAGTLYRIDAM